MNYDYPEATYERRREIIKEHETYQKGWLYFIANDPRVPKDVQEEMQQWGLPKDEFTDNGNWPHQLYIREARRMIGDYRDDRKRAAEKAADAGFRRHGHLHHRLAQRAALHHARRLRAERRRHRRRRPRARTRSPTARSCRRRGQGDNLLVPVCVSSSHIAFGSIRMEPVFMILGQSAATAACFAIDDSVAVQKVDYAKLRERLLADKQIIEWQAPAKKPK